MGKCKIPVVFFWVLIFFRGVLGCVFLKKKKKWKAKLDPYLSLGALRIYSINRPVVVIFRLWVY